MAMNFKSKQIGQDKVKKNEYIVVCNFVTKNKKLIVLMLITPFRTEKDDDDDGKEGRI